MLVTSVGDVFQLSHYSFHGTFEATVVFTFGIAIGIATASPDGMTEVVAVKVCFLQLCIFEDAVGASPDLDGQ